MSKHFKEEKKKSGCLGFILRMIGILLLIIVIMGGGMIGFLSMTEYKPADNEALEIDGEGGRSIAAGDSLSILSWNIGYGALGDNADFFMDGGTGVKTADLTRMNSNMEGIINEVKTVEPDILMLQEIDRDSTRSEHLDELKLIADNLSQYCCSFANNFKVAFLPYPWPPIGKVDSGIAVLSAYQAESAERVQLPIPFSWPIRMANLKRCLLVSRIPVENSDKELVIINLHLEAYDSGEGKVAQTKMLADILEAEANKGNYVIAAGDFNQIFSTEDSNAFPVREGMWAPGVIEVDSIKGDWQYLMDETTPTCRSLDQPYEGADHKNFQYYLIDGYIVSGNIKVNACETQDLGFRVSDHNPVLLKATLIDGHQ